eukprot:958753_1
MGAQGSAPDNANNQRKSLSKKKSTTAKSSSNKTNRNGLSNISENAETDDISAMGYRFNKKLTVNDFEFLKVVGKGSFGKVMMVRKNDTQEIFAMKVLKKKALVKRKQVIHTQTERRVLSGIDNPFIVSLRYAFQSDAKLYMILDFFNGGELFFHLKNEGRFSQKRSKFYSG